MHYLILFFAIFLFASCEFQKTTKLFCTLGEPIKLTVGVEIDEINKIIKLEFPSSYIEVSPYYYTTKFKRFKNNTYFLKDGRHPDIHIKEISKTEYKKIQWEGLNSNEKITDFRHVYSKNYSSNFYILKKEYEDEYGSKSVGSIDVIVNDIEVKLQVFRTYFEPFYFREQVRGKNNVYFPSTEKKFGYHSQPNLTTFSIDMVTGEANFSADKYFWGTCSKEKNI